MTSHEEADHLKNAPAFKKISAAFQEGGVPAVNTLVSLELNTWKEYSINVGVTGNSGVGKSTFINAIRGLSADDDGAAEAGVVETTTDPKPYNHPHYENIVLWDLPGVGTPTFTRDTYLFMINVNRYDYFIIIAACRFTENDKWLAEELQRRNKRFYFVRTKLSNDVRDDKRSHPKTHSKNMVIDTVRNDCEKNLVNLVTEVYLIDNYETNDYDFHRLSVNLLTDAPKLKRESLLLTLSFISESLILAKQKTLMKRVILIAKQLGMYGAIPFPGDIAYDIAVIVKEANFYKEQFGLSDAALNKYAQRIGMSSEALIRECGLKTKLIDLSAKGLRAYIIKLKPQTILYSPMKILSCVLPIVGSIIGRTASLLYCYATLKALLDMTVEDALSVSRYMKKGNHSA